MLRNPLYLYGEGDVSVPSHINLGRLMIDAFRKNEDKIAMTRRRRLRSILAKCSLAQRRAIHHDRKIGFLEKLINGTTHEKLTYRELLEKSINIALSLTEMGVKRGDTVAICSENRQENLHAMIGVLFAGATVSPMDSACTKDELTNLLNMSKPKIIFCSPTAYHVHEEIIKKTIHSIPIIYGNENIPDVLKYKDLIKDRGNTEDFKVPDVLGQTDTAVIVYTSGTTGVHKGIMLTHLNIITACTISLMAPKYMLFCLMPWMNIKGIINAFNTFCQGNSFLYALKPDIDLCLQIIEKYRIVHLSGVPVILEALSKNKSIYDVSFVKFIYTGAAALRDETVKKLNVRFPSLNYIFIGYGMSECATAVSYDFLDSTHSYKGGVGRIVMTNTVKVVDVESRKALGPNQLGEICVNGPLVMKGYVNKDRSIDFDDEDFFRTGDMGYYDDDQYIVIVNRLKDLIKYKDCQIAPGEIEGILVKHPSVCDAAVIGIPRESGGEAPCAFVVVSPEDKLGEDDIKEFVAARLPEVKHLHGVEFIDEIPKNRNGKTLHRQLRDIFIAKQSK